MAFKANRKPTVLSSNKSRTTSRRTKKTEEEISSRVSNESPAEFSPPQEASTSVDDFIGSPQETPLSVPEFIPEANRPSPAASTHPSEAPSSTHTFQSRRNFRPHYGNRSNHGGEGYDIPLPPEPAGFRHQGGYGYRDRNRFAGSRRPPMRRDFTYQENGMVQEITVPTETVKGLLDVMPEGHGFLRPKFTPSDRDVYISQSQIRRFLLRNGDLVEGQARQPKENERYWGLLKVEKINNYIAEEISNRPRFEDLTPVYPNTLLKLETGQTPLSTRIIDLIAPIGFGQRGLIVSPPKAGKTTIIKELASGIAANFPDVHLMAALIGERPEEVTDISRSIKGEVLASNFDESPQEQTRIAEVALDRAKRLVELGKDVVILLDSITRLARAYNLVVNPSGRTLSGGFDPAALFPAKRFLGAARCVEPQGQEGQGKTGGSLTVIGTALVDTGSRMDDMIYEEFKGTGNMELHLSRLLQERRIFPAIDIAKSGTRHDELLLGEERMKKVTTLRHMLHMLSDEERTLMLIDRMSKTESNDSFLDSLGKGA